MNPYRVPVFDPSTIPQVAVPSMNETHREEVALLNTLGELLVEALSGTPKTTDIDTTVDEWLAHTHAHFERENGLMRDHNFFAYAMHSEEHARVLAQLEQLVDLWRTTRDPVPLAQFVFEAWPAWFSQHVQTMDTITAQFLQPFLGE